MYADPPDLPPSLEILIEHPIYPARVLRLPIRPRPAGLRSRADLASMTNLAKLASADEPTGSGAAAPEAGTEECEQRRWCAEVAHVYGCAAWKNLSRVFDCFQGIDSVDTVLMTYRHGSGPQRDCVLPARRACFVSCAYALSAASCRFAPVFARIAEEFEAATRGETFIPPGDEAAPFGRPFGQPHDAPPTAEAAAAYRRLFIFGDAARDMKYFDTPLNAIQILSAMILVVAGRPEGEFGDDPAFQA